MILQATEFGKEIQKKLIDNGKTQKWLVKQVSEKTGLYCDYSYIHKICTGELATPKVVAAIREILDIEEGSE